MPEIKNTFLAGKMNKSLDDRILPQGEYRDALNVQITKAEDSDVGVIHNIKGNKAVTNVSLTGDGYDVIGSIFDDKNNVVYWIVTNNTNGYIFRWAVGDSQAQKIVSSESPNDFLGLSKSYKITGINILEDFLFWTDNYNPPRKINVTTATADTSYYNSRVKVSVAKYAPYLPPDVTSATHDETIKSKLVENEFIRFAYRYKFQDNEYSLISPFTPIVFKMETNIIDTSSSYYQTSDLLEIGASTEMPLMTNHINKVAMNIPLPQLATGATGTKEDYQIKEIDVLYKESDSNAVRIIETIKVDDNFTAESLEYEYRCTSFKATLAEEQITRVFDTVPLKAKAQEIVGNRVVYGNITNKKDLPSVDFLASYEAKENTNEAYAQHSVKQRRTYEAGIVLSDIYGRTSPVITTDDSTIYVGAKNKFFNNATYNGSALKMIFKTFDDPEGSLYNEETNPDGWYSYKIVIKQKEQEYYNVYVPGVWNYGISYRSYFQIHADNINKIPREFESNDENNLFSSSKVRVYPKVLNVNDKSGIRYRNSDFGLLDVIDIGKGNDQTLFSTARLFEGNKNHLVGKIQNILGTSYNDFLDGGDFAVFETEPFESALDIYYETPTTGLISEITENIDQFDINSQNPVSIENYGQTTASFNEDLTFNAKIANIYANREGEASFIPGSLVSFAFSGDVTDGASNVKTDLGIRFNEGDGQWELYLTRGVNYETIPNDFENERNFDITVTFLEDDYEQTGLTLNIENVKPIVTPSFSNVNFDIDGTAAGDTSPSSDPPDQNQITSGGGNILFTVYGTTGGRGDTERRKENLNFTLTDVEPLDGPELDVHHQGETFATYFSILSNRNYGVNPANGNEELFVEEGTALVVYHDNGANQQNLPVNVNGNNVDKRFKFKFTSSEDNTSSGFGSEALTSDEANVIVTFREHESKASSDAGGIDLYYAPSSAFANAFEACQTPVGTGAWSETVVHWQGDGDPLSVNDFPFYYDTNTATYPNLGRIYYDARLSRPASPGWYKRPDQDLIGFYFISGNEPESFAGWWYNTPDECAGLTREEAEDAATYNPPDEVVFEEDDGSNPYDLPDFNPRPQA